MNFSLNQCKYDFSSDNINIITLLYDQSGSMNCDIDAMLSANKAFYEDFSKFDERGSIAISKAVFSDYFYMTPFMSVKNFKTDYSTDDSTYLYSSISKAAENTIAYYNEIVKRLNVRPRITFLVFSDGLDNEWDWQTTNRSNAINAIKELNSLDATTVFVAFRDAIKVQTGEQLGFTCTRNISSVRELVSCLGSELSKSCKEQSRSAYSLKSEFFSKASKDSDDDAVAEQAIVDDDFFNV